MNLRIEHIKKFFSSKMTMWLVILLLGLLYLNLQNEVNLLRGNANETTSKDSTSQTQSQSLINTVEKLEESVGDVKDEVCASLSRIFELNGKVYVCPLGLR